MKHGCALAFVGDSLSLLKEGFGGWTRGCRGWALNPKPLNPVYELETSGALNPKALECGSWGSTHRPLSSAFLGIPCRVLDVNHKKELLRSLWVRFRVFLVLASVLCYEFLKNSRCLLSKGARVEYPENPILLN